MSWRFYMRSDCCERGVDVRAVRCSGLHRLGVDLPRPAPALERLVQEGDSAQAISTAVGAFVGAIGEAFGNPLLAALCRFFTRL
jgi:GntR family transcriptional regulator, transcriptional repressor for pyruvate dehydrogenase complex